MLRQAWRRGPLVGAWAARPAQTAAAARLACPLQQRAFGSSTSSSKFSSGADSGPAAPPRVLVLGGPTGFGKSMLAVDLAHRLDGEVVAASSMQVYHKMDIGTGKLPPAHRRGVRHHMVDVCTFDRVFSAGEHAVRATKAIDEILARGKTPIVVGSSPFYLHMLMHGVPGTPKTDARVEAKIALRLDGVDWETAYEMLEARDSVYAATVSPNDWYRLKRGLAIIESSGEAVSSFQPSGELAPAYDWRYVGLTAPLASVFRHTDAYCETVVARGLVEETIALLRAGLDPDSPAASLNGYRQALEFLYNQFLTTKKRSRSSRRRRFLRMLASFQARLRRANRNYWAQLERDRHALLVDRTQWTDEELVERLSRWLESGEQAAFPSERVSDPQPEYAPELVLFADEEVVDEKLRQITLAVQDYRDYLLRHDANAEFYAV